MDAAMPMIIINMGGEMVYILEQRLQAQSVADDKAKRVLQDVVKTMYNPKFVTELFRSQPVYSMLSTRQIFDRLAHSSIMRLNESSMDKLFDLMAMGFKYQMLCCAYPQELVQVTLTHLYELRAKVGDSKTVTGLIDEVIATTNSKYSAMSYADYAGLKQALCRFFADKRVKVSLFLQEGIQHQDGTIALSCAGQLPPSVDIPGTITYFGEAGSAIGVDSFSFPHAHEIPTPGDASQAVQRSLGTNMYLKKSKEQEADASVGRAAAAAAAAAAKPSSKPTVDSVAAERTILQSNHAQQATKNLNLLADLVGSGSTSDNFKLNLFPETSLPSSAGGRPNVEQDVIMIDAGRAAAQTNSNLMGIMQEMHLGGAPDQGPDSDLLDLMDKA